MYLGTFLWMVYAAQADQSLQFLPLLSTTVLSLSVSLGWTVESAAIR